MFCVNVAVLVHHRMYSAFTAAKDRFPSKPVVPYSNVNHKFNVKLAFLSNKSTGLDRSKMEKYTQAGYTRASQRGVTDHGDIRSSTHGRTPSLPSNAQCCQLFCYNKM